MMTLENMCLSLSFKERMRLCESLRNSIIKERMERRPLPIGRCGFLMSYMEEILGEPIPTKSRVTRYVWARTMVAYQLIMEGYSTVEVGKMLNKDHSTVIHLRNKMQDALDYRFAYMDIMIIWDQFQNKISNELHEGTT